MFCFPLYLVFLFSKESIPISNTIAHAPNAATIESGRGNVCGIVLVETNSPLRTKGFNVIEIESFTELLDARDNLNLPILYLNTIPHKEGIFYISNNNDIYILKVSNDKLDK